MKKGTLFQLVDDVTPANLKQAMQQAIEIEIATIPVYLYTYYSITRVPDQGAITKQILADFKAQNKCEKTDAELEEAAEKLGLDIMVFANKAGSLIMSVAVEEMLHMSLSSNIKNALKKYGGLPELVGKTPKHWPAFLPGHEPPFPINRAKLTLDQLYTFLLIESPLPVVPDPKSKAKAIPYDTIGDYYQKIIDCMNKYLTDDDFDADAPQLINSKFYSQNNVDTVYYDADHKPQFSNEEDSGGLVHVTSVATAVHAMDEIVEQGEGATSKTGKKGDHLTHDGKVVCATKINPLSYDDPSKGELSHFDKFLEIYCTIQRTNHDLNMFLGTEDFDYTKYFIKDLPTNPATTDYPEDIQKVCTLNNAIYTYLFVMAEGCYKKKGHTQFEIFMFGIHKTMIWLLNTISDSMAGLTYTDPKDKTTKCVSATFEDYDFSKSTASPKEQVIALGEIAMKVKNSIINQGVLDIIHDLPDVEL
ncbi:ferritin-like domain-containing protein [Dokdonia sp.]|uniref:ferritin-like domain-containing protein n=1 Tax=Dokdonia sp. TaxID=2024995 RepID=UPI003262E166